LQFKDVKGPYVVNIVSLKTHLTKMTYLNFFLHALKEFECNSTPLPHLVYTVFYEYAN